MRILLVDNYDSYTYNLCQLLAAACGAEPTVRLNDDPSLRALAPGDFDCLVISPGPGPSICRISAGAPRCWPGIRACPFSASAWGTRR